jgi:cytochrome c553
MRVKSLLLVMSVVAIATLFLSSSVFAAAADVIKMQTKGYEKHEKGVVAFSHKKHSEEYKAGCGECHHDAKGKPLANLKPTDKVQSCIECHKKPGEKPKGKDAPKLSKKEALEYHAEALHDNCQNCHKEFNKKNNSKAAPTTCVKCHEKK